VEPIPRQSGRSTASRCTTRFDHSIPDSVSLENYRRIVRLLGGTFRGMGIEILLHDLVNPSHSITCIADGEVTGRSEGMGTTSLVIDLKRRRALSRDSPSFKMTSANPLTSLVTRA